ncbi:MAG: alpha/beta hydrolase, partial [Myxococcales bacterium FL481]
RGTGLLYDIGSHRLYAEHLGATNPGPVILFEAGAGMWSAHWGELVRIVARRMPVIVYDRGGLGRSDPGPRPRSFLTHAQELSRLLDRILGRKHEPAFFVGHSYGARVVLSLLAQAPDRCQGLVLLDGYVEGFEETTARLGLAPPSLAPWHLSALALGCDLGAVRAISAVASLAVRLRRKPQSAPDLPGVDESLVGAQLLDGSVWRTLRDELTANGTDGPRVAYPATPCTQPITVVSASRTLNPAHAPSGFAVDAYNEHWLDHQSTFVGLSQRARQIVLEGDHSLHLAQAERVADIVIQAASR